MTREKLDKANEIASEIERIKQNLDTYKNYDNLFITPYRQSDSNRFCFEGRIKEKIVEVLTNECVTLEKELLDL